MAFHNVQFPTDISYGSSGGPGWKTSVIELSSGAEQRVAKWAYPRRKYDVSYGVRSYAQLSNLYEFYLARQGAANSFRYKDWFDYASSSPGTVAPSAIDQQCVLANGNNASYTSGSGNSPSIFLQKKYTSGSNSHTRAIDLPVSGTITVSVNGSTAGVTFTDNGDGSIVVNSASNTGLVKAGFEFDVPVRFADSADEGIALRMDDFSNASTSIELIEVTGENTQSYGAAYSYGGATALGTLSADATLTLGGGRVVTFASDSNTRKIKLPATTSLSLGGPYFYLINTSGSYEADVYTNDGSTQIGSVAANSEKTVVLGKNSGGTTTWFLVP